jgi:hypothetical protein
MGPGLCNKIFSCNNFCQYCVWISTYMIWYWNCCSSLNEVTFFCAERTGLRFTQPPSNEHRIFSLWSKGGQCLLSRLRVCELYFYVNRCSFKAAVCLQWARIVLVVERGVSPAERLKKLMDYSQPMSDGRRALVLRLNQSVSPTNFCLKLQITGSIINWTQTSN